MAEDKTVIKIRYKDLAKAGKRGAEYAYKGTANARQRLKKVI